MEYRSGCVGSQHPPVHMRVGGMGQAGLGCCTCWQELGLGADWSGGKPDWPRLPHLLLQERTRMDASQEG